MGKIIRNGVEYSGATEDATAVNYDNSLSGLNAQTVQEGIDELTKSLGDYEVWQGTYISLLYNLKTKIAICNVMGGYPMNLNAWQSSTVDVLPLRFKHKTTVIGFVVGDSHTISRGEFGVEPGGSVYITAWEDAMHGLVTPLQRSFVLLLK